MNSSLDTRGPTAMATSMSCEQARLCTLYERSQKKDKTRKEEDTICRRAWRSGKLRSKRNEENISGSWSEEGSYASLALYPKSSRTRGSKHRGIRTTSVSREERVGRVSIASTQLAIRRKGSNPRGRKKKFKGMIGPGWVNPWLPVYHASLETEFKIPIMPSRLQLLLRLTVEVIPIIPGAVDLWPSVEKFEGGSRWGTRAKKREINFLGLSFSHCLLFCWNSFSF